MALSDIQEAIERSIFHRLREKIVAEGYLPDIYDYITEHDNLNIAEKSQIAYQDAIEAIVADKGFSIEIFNYAPAQQRGTMKPPRIVIDTQAFLPGLLGHDTTLEYKLNEDGTMFDGNKFVSLTSDFYYSVRLVANTTKQIRVLHGLMVSVLPRRGYIKWYTDNELRPTGNLLNRYVSMGDFSWNAEGIIEKVYRYEIPDVHEVDPEIIRSVAPIIQIDWIDLEIIKT